jgi:ABC-type branched-subunit amino acid transport system ATPase component
MGDPDLILIDEPMEGLAPQLVQVVSAFLLALKSRDITVLLIEQKLNLALQLQTVAPSLAQVASCLRGYLHAASAG